MPVDFPPFSDRQRFPLLANASEIPPELIAADAPVFYAPEQADLARSLPRIRAAAGMKERLRHPREERGLSDQGSTG